MTTQEIIEQLDIEIGKLRQARALLADAAAISTKNNTSRRKKSGSATSRIPAVLPIKRIKRAMTAEGRAKIAEAQKSRWAAKRKIAKKNSPAKT